MAEDEGSRLRRAVDAVGGALPAGVVRWAASRGAPMARISGRTAIGTAALSRALELLSQPPRRLRVRSGTVALDDVAERLGRDVEDVQRWEAAGLLTVEPDPHRDRGRALLDRAALVDLALEAGADEETLATAAARGNLVLVALERVLTARGKLTGAQVAERADVPLAVLARVWTALGFPRAELETTAFDQRDVYGLRTLGALRTVFTEDDLAEAASVVGRASAEVSTAITDLFRRRIAEPFLEAGGTETDVVMRLAAMRDLLLPAMAPSYEVALRRHLDNAIRSEIGIAMEQLVEPGSDQRIMAIGFADLVGFTAASEVLAADEVRRLASELLRIAEQVVTQHGGRIVKSIGDAVMFATGEVGASAAAGVGIVERVGAVAAMPPVRVGIAHGPVLPGYADYFGRTVNLASRLCGAAQAGEVLLHAETAVPDTRWADAGVVVAPRGVSDLKGIGDVEALVVRRLGLT